MQVYNAKDWLGFIFKIHKSDTVRKLWPAIILMGLLSWLVAYLELDYFDLSQNSALKNTSILHTVIGFVLSLLLVFRTNTAYDRWWEGRKMWGKLVNDSRNLSVKLNALLPEDDKVSRIYFTNKIKLFAKVLHTHLTSESTKYMLDEEEHPEYEESLKAQHPPTKIVGKMYIALQKLEREKIISPQDKMILDENLNGLLDVAGACERIKNTPIPIAYAVFIKKFIFVYVLTLPIGYVFTTGYFIVPLVMIIFYVLLSIELIAEEIEDPFNGGTDDLPTAKIAENIGKYVSNVLKDNN
ncbi:putative membrane protein [Paenimyroides ummariense]|uniref:Putative membrane protein n=1 Tax=Paenimyroides ummariense TaxID=913024 RepID=A0A1I4XU44_9FLAO|nr:bestrophin family ion channel [Paenimyroides ummariense]SFN29324.1 putative membrane protein [Paenimyroides ummariense]